jgi:hypothetical protein
MKNFKVGFLIQGFPFIRMKLKIELKCERLGIFKITFVVYFDKKLFYKIVIYLKF